MIKKVIYSILTSLFLNCSLLFGQIDSLEKVIPTLSQDSILLQTLFETAWRARLAYPEKTIEYSRKALKLLPKIQGSPYQMAHWRNRAYTYLSVGYRNIGDFSVAAQHARSAIEIAEKNNLKDRIAFNKQYIAELYRRLRQIETAEKQIWESIHLFEELNHTEGLVYAYETLSSIHHDKGSYSKAYFYIRKAVEFKRKLPKQSTSYAQELYSLGAAQWRVGLEEVALKNLTNSLTECDRENDKHGKIKALRELAMLYTKRKEYPQALKYLYKMEGVVKLNNDEIRFRAEELAYIHAFYKRFDSAYFYQQQASALKDSIFTKETNLQITRMNVVMETTEKEAQIALLKEEQAYTSFQRNAFIAISLLGLGFIVFLIYANKQRRKANYQLKQQKNEIEAQAEELLHTNNALNMAYREIHTINQNLLDSINYARRIQKATLPFYNQFERLFPANFFIFFKPRDVVSGDFYFFEELIISPQKSAFILAVADCTGHGVPGAFMSMVGNQILGEVIIKMRTSSPDLILEQLNEGIRRTLRQAENQSQDGMDIALVTIYQEFGEKTHLEYAGAMNPLYYVHHDEFFEIKPTKKPIGGHKETQSKNYEKHSLPIKTLQGAMFYLCTDGFQDQFGGEHNKKFMAKHLKQLLHTLSPKPVQEQKQILGETFENWKKQGGEKQLDDVTIMGFRLS